MEQADGYDVHTIFPQKRPAGIILFHGLRFKAQTAS